MSSIQKTQKNQSSMRNSRNRSMESQNQTTVSQATTQLNFQLSVDPSGFLKLNLTEFLGENLAWSEWAELFDVIVCQMWLSGTEKMKWLKIKLTGRAKEAISGLGFIWQSCYQACNILWKVFGRPKVIVEAQHDNSSGIVNFAKVVTNTVNILTRHRFELDL